MRRFCLLLILASMLSSCQKETHEVERQQSPYHEFEVDEYGLFKTNFVPVYQFEEHFENSAWKLDGYYNVTKDGYVKAENLMYSPADYGTLRPTNSFEMLSVEGDKVDVYFHQNGYYYHSATWSFGGDSRIKINYDPGLYFVSKVYKDIDLALKVIDINEEEMVCMIEPTKKDYTGNIVAQLLIYKRVDKSSFEGIGPWLNGDANDDIFDKMKDGTLQILDIYEKSDDGWVAQRESNYIGLRVCCYDNGEAYYYENVSITKIADGLFDPYWVRSEPMTYEYDRATNTLYLTTEEGKTFEARILKQCVSEIIIEGNLGASRLGYCNDDSTYRYVAQIGDEQDRKAVDRKLPLEVYNMLFEDTQRLVDNAKEIDDERFMRLLEKAEFINSNVNWLKQKGGEWANSYPYLRNCTFGFTLNNDGTGVGVYSCCGGGEIMAMFGLPAPEGHENIECTHEWHYDKEKNQIVLNTHFVTKEGRKVDRTIYGDVVWFDNVYALIDGNFMNVYFTPDDAYSCQETNLVVCDRQRIFIQLTHPAYAEE